MKFASTPNSEIDRIFSLQSSYENLQQLKNRTVNERLVQIRKVERYLLKEENANKIIRALYDDLRKPAEETRSNEIATVLIAITHLKKNLKSWTRIERVGAPFSLLGFNSHIRYEPKGCVLLMSPWNFPFLVTLAPLVHAIAAGNSIIIKPSENAPASSAVLKQLIAELFYENEVAVIEGDPETATYLLSKPFHHIFFTGSPAVGKVIMKAAAEQLIPVTLELGGKSPVIIDETANVKSAAQKIAWAKTLNSGQSCVCPDYLLIHESRKDEFVVAYEKAITSFYGKGEQQIEASPYLGRIVNDKNLKRVKYLLDDAKSKGGKIVLGGSINEETLFVSPTIIENINDEMTIMHEEIFAPLLPVKTFSDLNEVASYINAKPRALSMYIFSKSKKNIRNITHNTTSGGMVINDLMVTIVNPELPFGGVNNSGIGKSNGKYSFQEFSNAKSVVNKLFDTLFVVYPPYRKFFINWLMRIARW